MKTKRRGSRVAITSAIEYLKNRLTVEYACGHVHRMKFVPRLVFKSAGVGVSVVGISVVPLCVSCSDSPGPVIYPAAIHEGGADSDAGDAADAEDVSTATEDADSDGPLGPIIYPPPP
jgi:hypothetical protein